MNHAGSKLKLRVFTNRSFVRKFGLKPDEANELTERIGNMASSNIVSRLESKIDAQNTKYNILIWAIGFAGLVISAAIIFSGSI